MDCLTSKAVDYVQRLKLRRGNIDRLKQKLERRFGMKDEPSSARRELVSVKQKEGESLEKFSQRILFLALDGHPGAKENKTKAKAGPEEKQNQDLLKNILDKLDKIVTHIEPGNFQSKSRSPTPPARGSAWKSAICHNCHKVGHYARYCTEPKLSHQDGRSSDSSSSNTGSTSKLLSPKPLNGKRLLSTARNQPAPEKK